MERNYVIYNRNFCAHHSAYNWRHYREEVHTLIEIWSDHKNSIFPDRANPSTAAQADGSSFPFRFSIPTVLVLSIEPTI